MVTSSFTALRRLAGYTFALTLLSLSMNGIASGQGTPPVTVTSAVGMSHPTGWGQIQQTAINSNGDWMVVDIVNGAVYEFPAGGGDAIPISGIDGLGGGYENPAVAIDPGDNLYLGANWNNCLLMFPWDAATKTWTGLSTLTPANPTTALCTNSGSNNAAEAWAQYGLSAPASSGFPGYFQPWGIAIGNNNNIIVGNQNSGNFIFSISVNNAWTNPTAGPITTEPINTMAGRPISVAQDPEGNIYFVEDPGNGGSLPGVYEIAAGTPELSTDAGLPRVDPSLPAVTGVITDAAGNLYISDSQVGVVMVPNPSGTPQTSSAVVLSGVPAGGEVAFDWKRNVMYVPTSQAQSNNQADVAKVGFGFADLGSSTVGTAATTGANVVFSFNASVTPASFKIVEDGVPTPDFTITGGTCTTGTAYAANKSCLQNVSFTPSSVGSISARLVMLDAQKNVLGSMPLRGVGLGANIQATPGLEAAIGGGLSTPTQLALDASGNTYVADAGLGKVLMFAPGSSTSVSIGTGLVAPTGVAVDGAGDVFIADSGAGAIYEVPFAASGLNAAGQVTLISGLGQEGLQLAADGADNLYVADPGNGAVIRLSDVGAFTTSNLGQSETTMTAGFTAPSALAVDANNNVYVIDGTNLFWLSGGTGAPVSLLNNLSGGTGVAVDPSGAVYISQAGGTVRIPSVSGTLVPANQTTVAATVTSPTSIALDRWGNVYLADGTALKVHVVGVSGSLALPTPSSLTTPTTATATIVNAGNAPLSVTGYTSTNAVDFSGADGTCEASSPLAEGGSCQVVVTFNPGAGEQGALSGIIGITSSAVNGPIQINAAATGPSLSGSGTSFTVASSAQVVNTPISVTVAAQAGAVVPTGTVTVSYPTWTVVTPGTGPNAGIPTINPTTGTATATLDGTGKASFTLAPVLAGSADSFTVSYSGDRVFGRSNKTVASVVAKSAITGIQLPKFPDPSDNNLPFVTASNGNGTVPYDGSELPWQYNFQMAVNTAAGVPTGTLTMMDNVTSCPPGTSATGLGVATCALAGYTTPGGYSGVACPNQTGAGVLTIQNSGAATGAEAQFPTDCLWYVPQGVSYSPVIFTHYLTPVFSGDANFLGLTGPTPTLLQVVRGPMLQITQTGNASSLTVAPTLTVTAGSTASMNLNLSSLMGYGIAGLNGLLNASNFPVSLACDNLPPHTQCSFTYPTPDPSIANAVDIPCPSNATTTEIADGSVQCTTGQAIVTFYTDVSAGTTTSQNARDTSVALAGVFGLGMFGLFFRRRSFQKARMVLMMFLMVVGGALAVSLTACNTTNLTTQSTLSTPPGTYAVTITADEVGTLCVASAGQGNDCIVPGSGATTFNGQLAHGSGNQVSLPFYVSVKVQ
jgi:hypothetical protein